MKGLSFGSQLDGMVVCDAAGNALRPSLIWMDRRAEEQAAALAKVMDEAEFYRRVGANLDSSHAVFKALWVRDNEPEVFAKAAHADAAGLVRALEGERCPGGGLLERVVAGAARPADARVVRRGPGRDRDRPGDVAGARRPGRGPSGR